MTLTHPPLLRALLAEGVGSFGLFARTEEGGRVLHAHKEWRPAEAPWLIDTMSLAQLAAHIQSELAVYESTRDAFRLASAFVVTWSAGGRLVFEVCAAPGERWRSYDPASSLSRLGHRIATVAYFLRDGGPCISIAPAPSFSPEAATNAVDTDSQATGGAGGEDT